MAWTPNIAETAGAHCLGIGCDHADGSTPRRASATPLRGRHSEAGRRERLRPSAAQSSRPTLSTRTTATPSSADASRSTSAVTPQS
jgi:hypothetical protein